MKYILLTIFCFIVPQLTMAQQHKSLEIDATSFAPIQSGALSGVAIDKISPDYSKRPCARIKLHVNRMSREEIANLSVKTVGGNIVIMRREVASEGNGLIIELTAKEQTRFYLHHDKYGDSNEVTLNLEGDKEYRLNAQLSLLQSIVVSTNVSGADVYIDDTYKGKTNEGSVLTVNDVMHGIHKIRVEYGVSKSERQIEVSSTNIHFRIEVNNTLSRPQYVVFEVFPKNASVVIDNKTQIPDQYGLVQVVLSNGTYSYSVSAKDYHTDNGTFVVKGEKVEKSIKLLPAHGWLKVLDTGALQGANVFVDGTLIGSAPITSDRLSSGTHDVQIVKNLYKNFEGKVIISDNETLEYAPKLVADFAHITLNAGGDYGIYVNDEYKGKSPWSGNIGTGTYIFEARKDGYRTTSISQTIVAEPQKQNYTIPTPTPILGTLNITSTPAMATVLIDDKEVGRTPLMKDLIIGKHTVSIRKEGYNNESKSILIQEGKTDSLNISLSEKKSYSSSSYSNRSSSTHKVIKVHYLLNETAFVYIDGTYRGLTNQEIKVSYGTHDIVVKHNGNCYGERVVVDKYSSYLIHMTGAPRVASEKSKCQFSDDTYSQSSSSTYKSSSSSSSTKVWAKVNYYDSDALVYVDGKYQGVVGHLFDLQSDKSYYVVVKNKYGMLYGKTIRTDYFQPNIHNVINMNGAPKVKSLYSATSSSSSYVYGSSQNNKKRYKKYNSWDSFNLGVYADLALILYDNTMFGLGVGLNWRLWRYNSVFIPMIGVRYMYGFDNSHVVGFPITLNLNWAKLFTDKASIYFGGGIEPSWLSYYYNEYDYDDWYNEVHIRYGVKCWDFPIVLNIIGVSVRHHDFNMYMNLSINNDDNITFGCRYTYLF